MDIEVIKELMQAFKEAELSQFELKSDEFELKLGKEAATINTMMGTVSPSQIQLGQMSENPNFTQPIMQSEVNTPKDVTKSIKAPIVGTFYRADSPKAQPFVEIGDYVHKGDVVCIIEAMKLMNEVEAEEEGEVVEILVQNEEMVEYNQPLIILK